MLVALGILSVPGPVLAVELHDFDEIGCDACHVDIDREQSEGKVDLRGGVDERCRSCHQPCPSGRKHSGTPGTPSSMVVPMPLDRTGSMRCHTCHDPHGEAPPPGGKDRSRLLRIDNRARGLCFNCHNVGGKPKK